MGQLRGHLVLLRRRGMARDEVLRGAWGRLRRGRMMHRVQRRRLLWWRLVEPRRRWWLVVVERRW